MASTRLGARNDAKLRPNDFRPTTDYDRARASARPFLIGMKSPEPYGKMMPISSYECNKMSYPFLIGESLRFGWEKTRLQSGVVFKVVLTLLALEVASAIVQKVLEGTVLGFLASLVLFAATVLLGIGATRITLRLAQGHAVHYRDLMPPPPLIWPYVAAAVLSGLAVLGGLILFIIPGIWVALRLSMVRFEVIEGARIRESLNKSWALTRGHSGRLALFALSALLLNLAGALALLVGLLVTIPVTMIAYAHIYQKLKAAHHHTH